MGLFRHTVRVSAETAREIERAYPVTSQHDSVACGPEQARGMAREARARGNTAAARELDAAADEAARAGARDVAFLKFS